MATHKSAIKRNRQNIKKREANRISRATVRTSVKKAVTAISTKGAESAELLKNAESRLASAGKKNLLHKRAARRKISRLAKSAAKAKKA